MLRYLNFKPSLKLQWCHAQDLFGSNSSDHSRVCTANLLHAVWLPNPLGHKAIGPNELANYIVCKRFTVQTLLWSLEFVIQIDLEHNTITNI